MVDLNTVGASFAFFEGDKIVWSRGFGYRNLEKRLPATPDTLYDVASVTKTFTVTAVLQLVEAGKLSLDDAVEDIIPDFHIRPGGEKILVKHLVIHTSGIPELGSSTRTKGGLLGTRDDLLPLADFPDYLLFMNDADKWTIGKPGDTFRYSNDGYVLLGYIVELVSGMSYQDYMKQHVLEPLGMTRSFFSKADVDADDNVATPYALIDGKHVPMIYPFKHVGSFSGLITSPIELAKFSAMMMNGGVAPSTGARVLSQESVDSMLVPRIPTDVGEGVESFYHYSYGYDVAPDFLGTKLAGHGGWIDISVAYHGYVPEYGIGAAVGMNGAGFLPDFIAMYGLAMMMGKNPEDLRFVEPMRLMAELPGTYKTYRDNLPCKVKQVGSFLMIEMNIEKHRTQTIILVPDKLTQESRMFYTMVFTSKRLVEFTVKNGVVEFTYERFIFRKDLPR
jgi:CubicO group peptidase (beta-lactamase class C family)